MPKMRLIGRQVFSMPNQSCENWSRLAKSLVDTKKKQWDIAAKRAQNYQQSSRLPKASSSRR